MGYQYNETVFVFGNLKGYLEDLEHYFRHDIRDIEHIRLSLKRNSNFLEDKIKQYERGYKHVFFFDGDNFGCPFHVNKTNYQQAIDWLNDKIEYEKKLIISQKINHSNILTILQDGKGLFSLDLNNYNYYDYIIKIKFMDSDKETIRMRIFFNKNSDNSYRENLAHGFSRHAHKVDGVETEIRKEENVNENIQTLESFIVNKKPRKSKLRIKSPVFEIIQKKDNIKYAIHLSDADIEMLELFQIYKDEKGGFNSVLEHAEGLYYGNPKWSASQGKKILRNLYGILSVEERERKFYSEGRWYTHFYISQQNFEVYKKSLENGGVFEKTINKKSLDVLVYIYKRSIELNKKYSLGFYPRFTIKEVSEKTGLNREKTEGYLHHLVGILATTNHPYLRNVIATKFFLPKSRAGLAREVLRINDLIE